MGLVSLKNVVGWCQNCRKMAAGGVTFDYLHGLHHWSEMTKTSGDRSFAAALFRCLARDVLWHHSGSEIAREKGGQCNSKKRRKKKRRDRERHVRQRERGEGDEWLPMIGHAGK